MDVDAVRFVKIDNSSPLFQYIPPGAWSDELTSSSSYTASRSTNSNATISFNGTRVDLYGTVPDSNGTSYTVTLYHDGSFVQSYSYAPPFSKTSPDLLFSADTIEGGLYTLDLTVLGSSSILIEYARFLPSQEDGNASVSWKQFNSTDSGFQWTPVGVWKQSGETSRVAKLEGAVTRSFIGDAVQIYGSMAVGNNSYSVTLDGGPPQSFTSAQRSYASSNILLYHAENLGYGNHTIAVANTGNKLTIDSAKIRHIDMKIVPSMDNPRVGAQYNLGLILGIALPLSLVLISFGVFIYFRRRRNRQAKDFQKLYEVEQFHVSDIRPVSAGRRRRFLTGSGNEDSEHLLTEEQPYNSIYDGKHSRDNSIVAANDVDVHRYNSLQVECVSVDEDPLPPRPALKLINPSVDSLSSLSSYSRAGEVEEDYAHLTVPGEPAPPSYSQATRAR